jgi:hypothetical protein
LRHPKAELAGRLGNQTMIGYLARLSPAGGQALAVSQPGDAAEREASAIAHRALSVAAPAQAVEPHAVERQVSGAPVSATATATATGSSAGRPLDRVTRDYFEPRFGADFSGVRIHDADEAHQAAAGLDAKAFTVGHNIAFARGQHAPASGAGRRLMAHELAHVVQQSTGRAHAVVQRQQADASMFGPPAPSAAGNDFDWFLLNFQALEGLAIKDGYGFDERVTAFRKLFYDSASAAKTYAGAVVGGGVWNILIPGAAKTALPPSWSDPANRGMVAYLKSKQVIPIGGVPVDIGHLLAGSDAAKHPARISLAGGLVNLRSNVEAATFVGDLGSVVAEYAHTAKGSFYDVAMKRSSQLDAVYGKFASVEDMAGNVDAYALSLDSGKSLSQNLVDYYAASSGGAKKRYTGFAAAIGLGALSGGKFSGDDAAWRRSMTSEVFNSALAYAAGKGWRVDVANVLAEPGPGLVAPTFWELYWNNSEWTVDIFVTRLLADAGKE